MGNWKNRLKSHGVPLSAIWSGWEKLAKEKTHKKGTQKKMWEKQNNQPLSTRSFKPMDSFSLGNPSK